ncbi:hypothetical protein BAUCODRAFT_486141 [Baudoinia panamericana UAMH 10762]|uniref:NAD-dependent epimerase/dehydratase domain-containing protein n=1 Tax=Baudoinia panamericana (strain UAMH 10762) TaxID=717646 RepID=M2NCQ5_BAUPA|nr:uncharacterized protein BAUCODRAFT_486141 [Baudoinia panamericana UAMH 10762]EMC96690.1 hypothetical protein BAUCODRAFT_486141 [Baudoinia panamericana UAMH 10762]
MSTGQVVLVTGGSGFIGSHCILQLLEKGYRVRTTVRKLSRADEVRQMLISGGASEAQAKDVEFFAADLMKDEGWTTACKGCTYVLHVASPFPLAAPKDENELIVPAREGTLRALKAAKDAGSVKRVVVTSSVAAVAYGHKQSDREFTEADWSILDDPSTPIPAYQKSKTIAERAAWDWIAKEGGDMELAVINPVGVFGPLLGKDYASSIELIVRLMNGALPGCPRLSFGVVDVRDVADLHIRAMTDPKAAGQRYIAAADGPPMFIRDMAVVLKEKLGPKANKVPTRELPDFLVRLAAWFDGSLVLLVPELGKVKPTSCQKAMRELGWQPRSTTEAVISSAESCEKLGLLK